MKVTIKGFVNYTKTFDGKPRYSVEAFSMKGNPNYLEVCPIELEIEIPDEFSPEKAEIATLLKQKEEYTRMFEQSIVKINQRLSELTALEYVEVEAVNEEVV